MADNPTDKNDLIAQLSGITGAAPQEVRLNLTPTSQPLSFH